MQTIYIEFARLAVNTQRTICQNLLDGMDQVRDQSLMWVERKLDRVPFIPEAKYRWMEEWVRIGKEGSDNFKRNLDELFEDADTLSVYTINRLKALNL